MSREEVESTYQMLIIAGSETIATALVGTINLLAQNPDQKEKLTTEILTKFKASTEIDVTSTRDMPYLTACINEGLRLCNPVPAGLPRCAPATGAFVCGYWLPGNVIATPTHIS
jgi:cytochrome P450